MKKTIFSLFFFSALFLLLGCQDNNLTNPVSPDYNSNLNKSNSTLRAGAIILDQIIPGPDRVRDYYHIKGEINYSDRIVNNNAQDVSPQLSTAGTEVELENSINAVLKEVSTFTADPSKTSWKVSSRSEDLVNLSYSGRSVLVKSYPVIGRTDKMLLVCTFDVTSNSLSLKNIKLTDAID